MQIDPHEQVVEDEKQYAKIKAFRDELPHLKAVVMYGGKTDTRSSWLDLMIRLKLDEVHNRLQALEDVIDYFDEIIISVCFE